jgi:hypothetical protein
MPNEIITSDGEVIEQAIPDQSLAIGLTRAEIDQQIATARAFPRSIKRATDAIFNLATLDEQTAEECTYALPRGGKPITGPSIRLAEIIQQSWGNCRVAARVVHVDRTEKFVEAEGVYHDLETNSATMARVRRRIVDAKGKLYSDDMIIVTGNAACSIAKRNAILSGVPKPVWRQAEDAVRKVVAGTIETLTVTRERSMSAFSRFGVKPEQVYAALGVQGLDDIGLELIPVLRGMFAALKNGEATVEEMFSPRNIGGIAHKVVANPLSDDAPAGAAELSKTDKPAPAADAPKTAALAPAGTPAAPNTTNSPIAADASPGSGAQADPEKPLQDVRSGSATDQAPPADDDTFPADRPATAATKAAGRKFIKNLAE